MELAELIFRHKAEDDVEPPRKQTEPESNVVSKIGGSSSSTTVTGTPYSGVVRFFMQRHCTGLPGSKAFSGPLLNRR